jgi:glutathione synthase/RimK-type ligase-like ATP-grasp enzyme
MITIGLLHTRLDPNLVSRAYLYSAIARVEGFRLFYFTSRDVDFEKKKINGKVYRGGSWVAREFSFPDVVLNVAGPNTARQRAIYDRLAALVPFTSYRLGHKTTVYNKLIKGKTFLPYIIPFRLARKAEDVIGFLNQHGKIIIKPNGDSHGNYIYYIEKDDDGYRFIYRNSAYRVGADEIKEQLASIIAKRSMIMQKYINSRRKKGEAYDFRLHVQKNGSGIWQITAIFPRVANDERIITNLSQGAFLSVFERFIENEFPDEHKELKFKIEGFALLLARHLDEIYDREFDELGIDIGLDEAGKIWIYEVNWRPGHVYIEVKAARAAVNYAAYLARKKKKERENETPKPKGNNQGSGN